MGVRWTRRRFVALLVPVSSVALAGCTDDDDLETGERAVNLEITLETADGEPVSEGIEVVIEHEDGSVRQTYQYEIENGRVTGQHLSEPGTYTVTVESLDDADDFDRTTETVELDAAADVEAAEANAVAITLVLEGALSDAERAAMADDAADPNGEVPADDEGEPDGDGAADGGSDDPAGETDDPTDGAD